MTDQHKGPPFLAPAIACLVGAGLLVAVLISVNSTVAGAAERLKNPEKEKPQVATADHAEAPYCTPQFKQVLERVLHSCGLMEAGARRGCKPADVKTFASISDDDFNSLFRPLKDRGSVILFDTGKEDLDDGARQMIAQRWADRRGARYFLVVGRASKTGTIEKNRALSHRRTNSVLFHIKELSADPEVDKKVGLLWLGSEFAQMNPKEFCSWNNSRAGKDCDDEAINRSAFASWVDCRL